MSVDQILMVGDDGALICDILDEEAKTGASLIALVDDWVVVESIDGKLHPYLDESLWVLKGFNDAMIYLIEHFEEDDPHREGLLEIYKLGRAYVNNLLVALNGEAGT